MKKSYVFVGGLPSHMLGVVSFTSWGQARDLTAEQAKDLSLGGAAIVPADEFIAIGITAAELAKFGPFGAHANATPEFQVKKAVAVGMAEKTRAAFEALAPNEEAA